MDIAPLLTAMRQRCAGNSSRPGSRNGVGEEGLVRSQAPTRREPEGSKGESRSAAYRI